MSTRRIRQVGLAIAIVFGLGFAIADNATAAALGVLAGGVVAVLADPVSTFLSFRRERRE